ncbi:hypothetical protein, partial [Stenomitos frigidus]
SGTAKAGLNVGLTPCRFTYFCVKEPIPALNLNSILLVSAKHGVLAKVWGPVLCQDGGRLVLQVGGNVFPVTQTGNTFTCGQLTGQLAFTPTRFARSSSPRPLQASPLSIQGQPVS